jgi:hypothetical protein
MDHDHDSVSRRGVWGPLGHLDARRAPRRTQRPGRLVPTDRPSAHILPIRNLFLAIRHLLRKDSGKPSPGGYQHTGAVDSGWTGLLVRPVAEVLSPLGLREVPARDSAGEVDGVVLAGVPLVDRSTPRSRDEHGVRILAEPGK